MTTRYFVARTTGEIRQMASLVSAKNYAANLYDAGVIAPLIVVAPDKAAAADKAARCYRGEITAAQARKA